MSSSRSTPSCPQRRARTNTSSSAISTPALQLEVLDQTQHTFVALDSMNLWIEIALEDLKKVLARVDCIILNDSEAKLLTGETNLRKAARIISELGPDTIVIKKGEHGAMLFSPDNSVFSIPALPLEEVIDPTGAGDSFAGGFMGYIAREKDTSPATLRQAMVYGSACASHTCEAFGPDRLAEIEASHIEQRFASFKDLIAF
jgi:sugar/nucleoside kinase (ribokinase family)